MHPLTKLSYLATLTCPTQGWFYRNKQNNHEPTISGKFLSEMGIKIGEMARECYPSGILVHEGGNELNYQKTMQLIKGQNDITLFEATFCHNNAIARADILRRENGSWHLIEVKSSLSGKDEFIDDLAYTATLAQLCGITLNKISLMHVSRDYRLGMNNQDFFVTTDCTDLVQEKIPVFISAFDRVVSITGNPERPLPTFILACKDCEFFSSDCLGKSITNPVFDIPNMKHKKFDAYVAEGITEITHISDDSKLTDNQSVIWQAVKDQKPTIDFDGLKSQLDAIIFPVCYLDFESVNTAIPLYPDLAPYHEIVTQYSIHHYSDLNSETRYSAFLSDHTKDDRRLLAENLLKDIAGDGSVIVFHAQAEKRFINSLAVAFPDLSNDLNKIIDRIVDLKVILNKGYYHPDFHGSYSIKVVLPVLVPTLSYESLDVGDGLSASAVFAQLAQSRYSDAQAIIMRINLLEYCKQDTLAMVKTHQKLAEMVVGY